MACWRFASRTPEESFALGRALGRSIGVEGLVIGLVGPLGAGKTLLVKGLAEGLGLDPRVVSSPTFVIAQQYPLPDGPHTFHHVDLYRLDDEAELEAIGFDDLFEEGAVLAVEWADRFPEALGETVLWIELAGPSASEADDEADDFEAGSRVRTGCATAQGALAERVLADWRERAGRPQARGAGAAGRRLAQMRLGLALALAWSIYGLGGAASDAELLGPCPGWRAVEADRLGTRVVECLDAEPQEAAPVTGVARWLRGERVDLGRASAALLEALPGIGPRRARAIVDWRERQGFASIESLERVAGIGPATRERLARWLTLPALQAGDAEAAR